jgi:predicted secreted protein
MPRIQHAPHVRLELANRPLPGWGWRLRGGQGRDQRRQGRFSRSPRQASADPLPTRVVLVGLV